MKTNRRAVIALSALLSLPAFAQAPPMAPGQLDGLVQRIALYPDPLLAQVLTASTYWTEIPDAAAWSSQHSYMTGDALARAVQEDNLPWDPSVIALLPFPSVLQMMNQDPGWTQALGNAVLVQNADVMDAVQRMRQQAYNYGYLRTTPQYRVVAGGPGDLEILPVDPAFIFVPVYSPGIVFFAPRPGFFIGGAISFGPRIVIGAAFRPWGWGAPGFSWRAHTIVIDGHPWARTWANRGAYVHPYVARPPRPTGPRVERHETRPREEHEKERH